MLPSKTAIKPLVLIRYLLSPPIHFLRQKHERTATVYWIRLLYSDLTVAALAASQEGTKDAKAGSSGKGAQVPS